MANYLWANILSELSTRPDFEISSLLKIISGGSDAVVAFEHEAPGLAGFPNYIEIQPGDNGFWVTLVPDPRLYLNLLRHLPMVKNTRTGPMSWSEVTYKNQSAVGIRLKIGLATEIHQAIDKLDKELRTVDKICQDFDLQLSKTLRGE